VEVIGPPWTDEIVRCTHCGKNVGPLTFLPVLFADGHRANYNIDVLEIDEGVEE
jgi:hypothetical protein